MRLIDAEPLLKAVNENKELYERERLYLEGLLLNAPTVDLTKNQAYDKGFITAMKLYARPKCKWIIAEVQCPNCFKYFELDYCPTGELNKCPNCGAENGIIRLREN